MITDNQYFNALKIIREYHKQIEDKINEIELKISHSDNDEKRLAVKARCISIIGSQGNNFPYLTIGKEYNILKSNFKSEYKTRFKIIADNGKKRTYRFNQSIWLFIYE